MLARVIAFIILLLALKIMLPDAFGSLEHAVAMFFDGVADPNTYRIDNVANSAYQMNTAGYFPQTAQMNRIQDCGIYAC